MNAPLPLPKPVTPELASDIEKASAYVSGEVSGLRVAPDGRSVTWTTAPGADPVRVAELVGRFVRDMVAHHRPIPRRVVGELKPAPGRGLHSGIEAGLRARGWVRDLGPGQVSLSGPALAVMRAVDEGAAIAGSPARDVATAARCPAFRAHLQRQVDAVNGKLARVQTVKRFAILPHELSIAGGELTPTMKLKRRVIVAKYAAEIESLYAEA